MDDTRICDIQKVANLLHHVHDTVDKINELLKYQKDGRIREFFDAQRLSDLSNYRTELKFSAAALIDEINACRKS